MTTAKTPKKALNASNYDSLFLDNAFLWWHHPWIPTNSSTVEIQHIWYDAINDSMRHELELFSTLTSSYSKLTTCMLGLEGVQTPFSMMCCYHELASDLTKATFKRMQNASEYSEELKERLWTEL